MTVQERMLPQLMMRRPTLSGLDKLLLPQCYSLRHYIDSTDDRYWEQIISESFSARYGSGYFADRLKSSDAFRPERVLFICCNDKPVATASAWHSAKFGVTTGQVHYVGVLPGHQGKKLGYLISLAVLYRFVTDGFTDAILETDDFRIAAIKTYIKLGFEPLLVNENQRQRWKDVLSEIVPDNQLELKFADNLSMPIQIFNG
jgi:mycothiol synthase